MPIARWRFFAGIDTALVFLPKRCRSAGRNPTRSRRAHGSVGLSERSSECSLWSADMPQHSLVVAVSSGIGAYLPNRGKPARIPCRKGQLKINTTHLKCLTRQDFFAIDGCGFAGRQTLLGQDQEARIMLRHADFPRESRIFSSKARCALSWDARIFV